MVASSVPDRFDTEPIIAWRYWYALPRGGQYMLTSPVMSAFDWGPGQRAVARCVEHEVPAPVLSCSCGIHGAASREVLEKQVKVPLSTSTLFVVAGQVSLWGRVEEHDTGYRAQYAYPYSLYIQPIGYGPEWLGGEGEKKLERAAHQLAAAYAVETEVEYSRANWRAGTKP